jgi:hypothetical protein
MKKYNLIQMFDPQLETEHNSRKNCEKFLVIFKIFVNIAFHVQFFHLNFSWTFLSSSFWHDLNRFMYEISAQKLTNERNKQDFFNHQILEIYCSKSHYISNFLSHFFLNFLLEWHDLKNKLGFVCSNIDERMQKRRIFFTKLHFAFVRQCLSPQKPTFSLKSVIKY